MPNIHLTDSEVTYLYSVLTQIQSRWCVDDKTQLHECTEDEIVALTNKIEPYHFNAGDKHCPVCLAVITSPNPRKITCSDACRQAHGRNMKKRIAAAIAKDRKARATSATALTASPLCGDLRPELI